MSSDTMTRSKVGTSFRLSDQARELLSSLSKYYGISQTGVVEMLLRKCDRREGSALKDPYFRGQIERARDSTTPLHMMPFRLSPEAFAAMDNLVDEVPDLSQAEILEICLRADGEDQGLT